MDPTSEILKAIEVLRSGGLVALPTETVYGLGADASNDLAVRRIFAVKGRPSTHPLIVHVASLDAARPWARTLPEAGERLARAFWPGPLTLIVKRSELASDAVTGGQDTVGLRVPAHPMALALLEAFQGGIAAPSANRFGRTSPTTADHVRDELGTQVDVILDGGPCEVGVESTIVDVTHEPPRLLRPGGISREAIEKVLGAPVDLATDATDVRAPGMLESHYAPHAGLWLVTEAELFDEAVRRRDSGARVVVLAPGESPIPPGVQRLPIPSDDAGFAQVLYARLRQADGLGDLILAVPPPESGLGLAVRDRLRRAATPRPPSLENLSVAVPALPATTPDDLIRRLQAKARLLASRRERVLGESLAMGDEVLVDTIGYVDGRLIPFSARFGNWLDLVPQPSLPGFYEGIAQAKVGETAQILLVLPPDYAVEALRNQPARFLVEVRAARELRVPDLESPTFLAQLKMGDDINAVMDALRTEHEAERRIEQSVVARDMVLNEVANRWKAQAPRQLVDDEIRRRWLAAEGNAMAAQAFEPDEQDEALETWLTDAPTRAECERRIRIGLALKAMVDAEKLELTPEHLRALVTRHCAAFGLTPTDVEQALKENTQQLIEMGWHLFAVEYALSKATITQH